MKKSTGIVFLVVVLLGLWAYFREWRGHAPSDQSDNPNAPVTMAFKVDENQINHLELTRNGMTMVFDRKEDGWYVTSPIMTRADQTAVGEIVHTISELPGDRTLQVTPAQVSAYGLANPAMVIKFKLQNGATHTMAIGGKDFSGLEVYSRIDGSKDVGLFSNLTANAADKPFDQFRDHTVLNFSSQYDVTSFDLKNSAGEISVKKDGDQWEIEKPIAAPGDFGAIGTLLGNASAGKIQRFISDDAKNVPAATLAQYGLNHPSIQLDVNVTGGKTADLLIGKKDGLEAYAMDTSRSMIFTIPQDLYNTLDNQKVADLQSKMLFSGIESDVTRLEVRNPKGVTQCVRDANGNWVVDQGSGKSGQAPDCPDYLTPLDHATATAVENNPSAEVLAKLAKPAIVVTLTEAQSVANANPANPVSVGNPAGQSTAPRKTLQIQISGVSGNSVYARTGDGSAVYRFDKAAFDALNAGAPAASTASSAPAAVPSGTSSAKAK